MLLCLYVLLYSYVFARKPIKAAFRQATIHFLFRSKQIFAKFIVRRIVYCNHTRMKNVVLRWLQFNLQTIYPQWHLKSSFWMVFKIFIILKRFQKKTTNFMFILIIIYIFLNLRILIPSLLWFMYTSYCFTFQVLNEDNRILYHKYNRWIHLLENRACCWLIDISL